MQGVALQKGRHECMNCMSPMHGGLCGYEVLDGIPDGVEMTSLIANLSAHGKDIADGTAMPLLFVSSASMVLLLPIVAKLPQIVLVPLVPLLQCAIRQMVMLEKDQVSFFLTKRLTVGWMIWIWLEYRPFLQLQSVKKNSASSFIPTLTKG